MSRRLLLVAASLAILALAGGAEAQTASSVDTDADADASLAIRDAVQVSTLELTTVDADGVTAATPSAAALVDATSVIQVSGDAGRAYRIRLPKGVEEEGRAVVEAIEARSDNSGKFSTQQTSHMDTDGRDVVRLTSRLSMKAGEISSAAAASALSFSVDVE